MERYRVGRPKIGEVRPVRVKRKVVGRPRGINTKRDPNDRISLSLGYDTIELLNEIANQQERNRSAIIRDCIDAMAREVNLPTPTVDFDEEPFRQIKGKKYRHVSLLLKEDYRDLLDKVAAYHLADGDIRASKMNIGSMRIALLKKHIEKLSADST